jgi:hypothetical protein
VGLTRITRDAVLTAIQEIDSRGVPAGRQASRFDLVYEGRHYPPKYVVGLAHKYATGQELSPQEYSGGAQTNSVLTRLGFDVIERSPPRRKPEDLNFPSQSEPTNEPRLTSREPVQSTPSPTRTNRVQHREGCSECKYVIEEMLRSIYGKVKREHKIEISTSLDAYRGESYFGDLEKVWQVLAKYRGFTGFARNRTLQNCDYFVPDPGFVLETDESQHFTMARSLALTTYPLSLKVGFDRDRWNSYCKELNRKDPNPPDRDESRAWTDTLRDFLPRIRPGMEPTVRVRMGTVAWCQLDPEDEADIAQFRALLAMELPPRLPRATKTGESFEPDPLITLNGGGETPVSDSLDGRERLDLKKLRAQVLVGSGARIARIVLAGRLAQSWRVLRSSKNARELLRKTAQIWPEDHPVEYLVSFGGFLRFKWPFPTTQSRDGISWDALVTAASAEARTCLDDAVMTALGRYAKYVTIGIDSRSVEDDLSMPHAELVGLFSVDGSEEHWTGKTKPVPSQKEGLIEAPVQSHFQIVGGQHVVILGCHDLNLFSPRVYANSGERKRAELDLIRRKLIEWKPTTILQHPHYTDTSQTWAPAWSGAKALAGEALRAAVGGVRYARSETQLPRRPLKTVLRATAFGPVLDFVLDIG